MSVSRSDQDCMRAALITSTAGLCMYDAREACPWGHHRVCLLSVACTNHRAQVDRDLEAFKADAQKLTDLLERAKTGLEPRTAHEKALYSKLRVNSPEEAYELQQLVGRWVGCWAAVWAPATQQLQWTPPCGGCAQPMRRRPSSGGQCQL